MLAGSPRIVGDALLAGGTIAGNLIITGNLTVQGTTTSVVNQTTTGTVTISVANAAAFAVGPNGNTNPTLRVVTNTASAATGLSITSAAAAGGLALAVISSGTNENLTLNAKGSGTIGIGSISTGAVTITPALSLGGNLTFVTDNNNDIGASGATRPKDLYLAGIAKAVGNVSQPDSLAMTASVTINALPTSTTITPPSSSTWAYVWAGHRIVVPSVAYPITTSTGDHTFLGLDISQAANGYSNQIAGDSNLTFTGISIAASAGSLRAGTYTFKGVTITTPSQGDNALANDIRALDVVLGTSHGAASATQTGLYITGGTQTAGTQRGVYINMADAAHTALWVDAGVSRFDGNIIVSDGTNDIHAINTSGSVVFNEQGSDIDFRIESDTGTNVFNVDAGLHSGVGGMGFGQAATANRYINIAPPALTATAGTNYYEFLLTTVGAVSTSGTTPLVTTLYVDEPNITVVSGSVTTAVSLYVSNAPTEGGSNYALFVDAGVSRFDGNVLVGAGAINSGTNVLVLESATAPTGATIDQVAFYSSDISAGHTEPSFYCEGTSVLATGQADSASSVRVKMRINGTEVTILCL